MSVIILIMLVITSKCIVSEDRVIGALFYRSEDNSDDLVAALKISASMNNFSTLIKEVPKRVTIIEIRKFVCELAEEGVVGIIDGIGGRASEHIQAISDMLELPHIALQHNDMYARNWSLLNLYPSPSAYNMILKSLIEYKDWTNFTILYVKGHSILNVNELLRMGNSTDKHTVTVRELSGDDYRGVLINAKENGFVNFVVDCPSDNLEQLLLHAQQVALMAEEHSYIFLSPDLFTLDMSRYRYGGVNMTGFRLLELTNNDNLYEFATKFNNDTGREIEPEDIKTKVLLIHDAVLVINAAMKKVKVVPSQLSCENYDSWPHGSSLLNFMRTNKIEGLTRTLMFDGLGQRSDVVFDVLELTSAGYQTMGTWRYSNLTITRQLLPDTEIGEESILRNKTLKVLISKTPPYAYVKESADKLEGNARYEGFTIDLIEKLSEILGFNYEFVIEEDYGSKNPENGKWTGMVFQLREDRADLAICDLTITAEKQSVIDFSQPFMTLGIAILYKEPSKQPPEMFSFMAVFAKEVWINMLFIQLGLGIIMIFVGRISNKEWQNPVPCIEQPEELNNQFSFANSMWLIIGSVMQQGSEIAPIALAPRMITSIWWFFTMVMVASYTGTLVAFLTVETNVQPFQTVEELYKHKSISYGAKGKGSTINFFKDSHNEIFKNMYEKMLSRGWLVENNDVGVALYNKSLSGVAMGGLSASGDFREKIISNCEKLKSAENSTYAFFMESTTLEYYIERHCDLIQVGDLLDSKSYGIGMKQKSPYKRYIDDALLILKERGEIQKLKNIWWKEKRGGGKCGEKTDEEQQQLGMKHLLGAFVVLGVGSLFGLFISILDMLWGVFKRSVKYSTTFKYELIEELKFALKFSGNVKPVRRDPKQLGSSEALAEAEGRDEVKSLRSIHTARSTDTHRTHRSHGSRHSSRSLSVAFARRRDYS